MSGRERRGSGDAAAEGGDAGGVAPGRRTLTQGLGARTGAAEDANRGQLDEMLAGLLADEGRYRMGSSADLIRHAGFLQEHYFAREDLPQTRVAAARALLGTFHDLERRAATARHAPDGALLERAMIMDEWVPWGPDRPHALADVALFDQAHVLAWTLAANSAPAPAEGARGTGAAGGRRGRPGRGGAGGGGARGAARAQAISTLAAAPAAMRERMAQLAGGGAPSGARAPAPSATPAAAGATPAAGANGAAAAPAGPAFQAQVGTDARRQEAGAVDRAGERAGDGITTGFGALRGAHLGPIVEAVRAMFDRSVAREQGQAVSADLGRRGGLSVLEASSKIWYVSRNHVYALDRSGHIAGGDFAHDLRGHTLEPGSYFYGNFDVRIQGGDAPAHHQPVLVKVDGTPQVVNTAEHNLFGATFLGDHVALQGEASSAFGVHGGVAVIVAGMGPLDIYERGAGTADQLNKVITAVQSANGYMPWAAAAIAARVWEHPGDELVNQLEGMGQGMLVDLIPGGGLVMTALQLADFLGRTGEIAAHAMNDDEIRIAAMAIAQFVAEMAAGELLQRGAGAIGGRVMGAHGDGAAGHGPAEAHGGGEGPGAPSEHAAAPGGSDPPAPEHGRAAGASPDAPPPTGEGHVAAAGSSDTPPPTGGGNVAAPPAPPPPPPPPPPSAAGPGGPGRPPGGPSGTLIGHPPPAVEPHAGAAREPGRGNQPEAPAQPAGPGPEHARPPGEPAPAAPAAHPASDPAHPAAPGVRPAGEVPLPPRPERGPQRDHRNLEEVNPQHIEILDDGAPVPQPTAPAPAPVNRGTPIAEGTYRRTGTPGEGGAETNGAFFLEARADVVDAQGNVIMRQGQEYLFKPPETRHAELPGTAEAGLANDGTAAQRSAAASRIADRMGVSTPETNVVTIDGQHGTIQPRLRAAPGNRLESMNAFFRRDRAGLEALMRSERFRQAEANIRTLDYVLNNVDRGTNYGNYMIETNSAGELVRLVPIDHDLSLGAARDRTTFMPIVRGEGVGQTNRAMGAPGRYSPEVLGNLRRMVEQHVEVREQLRPFLSDVEIDGVFHRIQEILVDAESPGAQTHTPNPDPRPQAAPSGTWPGSSGTTPEPPRGPPSQPPGGAS